MARKKQEDPPKQGAPEYMSTYGDMMTLVLCFFVLLFSMSTLEIVKFQQVAQSMNEAFTITMQSTSMSALQIGELMGSGIAHLPYEGKGLNTTDTKEITQTRENMKKMASDFKTYFAQEQFSDKIVVEQTNDYVKIRFNDSILFDLGSADIKQDAYPVLNTVADQLMKYPGNDIKVEGHTDNLPIKTARFSDNWELSAIRSLNVMRYFINQKSFSPERMSAEGFGEYQPIDTNDTPEGRAKNRRVEIMIMGSNNSGSAGVAPVQ